MDVREEKYLAIKKVHQDFLAIMKLDRCRTCACLNADMLASILETISAFRKGENTNRLVEVESGFENWLKEAEELDLHG